MPGSRIYLTRRRAHFTGGRVFQEGGKTSAQISKGGFKDCQCAAGQWDEIGQEPYVEVVDGEKQSNFGQAKEKKLTNRCKRCDPLHLCNGGCPAHRIVNLRNKEYAYNYLCEGYRIFYAHTALFKGYCLGAWKSDTGQPIPSLSHQA